MVNMAWLAQEAKIIHTYFDSLFYVLLTVFLLVGILMEYFKWPLGDVPGFPQMVGRVFVATILLVTLPDIMDMLANLTDAISNKLGDLNDFDRVLSRMGDELESPSWSWLSKEGVMMIISFLTFFGLYFSVHICEALFLYTWTLLYVFAPLLIALFVFPVTSVATKALYRSLIEVSCWKIVWSVLATLLWSAALSDLGSSGKEISWLTAISFNIILAGSLLLTPIVVHSLAGKGIANMSKTVGGIMVGATFMGPGRVLGAMNDLRKYGQRKGSSMIQYGHRQLNSNRKPRPTRRVNKPNHSEAPKNMYERINAHEVSSRMGKHHQPKPKS